MVAPTHWTSPRDSVGLRMFAASSEPSAEPAPISEWISSMKMITSSERGQLGDDALQPLLELPAVLGARRRPARDPAPGCACSSSDGGTSPSTMRVASPSTIAVLPTPGSPSSTGLFLRRRERTWIDALQLRLAPDQRIEHPSLGHLGQVARELVEERRLFLLLGQRAPLVDVDRVLAHREQPHAALGEQPAGGGVLQAQQAEQDVLGADVRVHQPLGFFLGVLQDPLGLVAERDLDRGGELLPERAAALQFGLQQIHRDVGPGEQLARRLLAFFQQAEQDVLGADPLAALLAGLVTGQEQDPFGLFGEFFEHRLRTSCDVSR